MTAVVGQIDLGYRAPNTLERPTVFEKRGYAARTVGRVKDASRAGYNQGLAVPKLMTFYEGLGSLADELLFHMPSDFAGTDDTSGNVNRVFSFGNQSPSLGRDTTVNTGTIPFASVTGGRKVLDCQNAVPINAASYLSGESLYNWMAGLPGWTAFLVCQFNLMTGGTQRVPISIQLGSSVMFSMGHTTGIPYVGVRHTQNGTNYQTNGGSAIAAADWIVLCADFQPSTGTVHLFVDNVQTGSRSDISTQATITSSLAGTPTTRLGNTLTTNSGAKIADFLMFPRVLNTTERTAIHTALAALNPQLA